MAEDAGDALDDRQAEAEAGRLPRALLEPVKLVEHRALLMRRNADAGVVDVDAQTVAAAAAADQHAPRAGVLDGVRHEVLHEAAQQAPVRPHGERGAHEIEGDALRLGERREVELERTQQVVDAERGDVRGHRAGVEPRDFEQRRDDVLHRLERSIDIVDEAGLLAGVAALDEARHVEARGVERLEDVVARRGEEPRLRDVRRLRGRFRLGERGVEALELAGALPHPQLEALHWRSPAPRRRRRSG